MHVDWKCIKYGEKHLTLINEINNDTPLILTCLTCNTTFSYKILSLKYSIDCLVSDSKNNCIGEQNISSWH
ncbi:hypothetical protein DP124_00560 [Clostridium tetani]|nr:hypothetical protein DP122_11090 [Clostridium tetani]RXI56167.1 hypothetical protein DP124_00560 [Clostridium tetani]RXM71658.1 hypothetical protein DP139_03355 [Clostridium tetani]BDR85074.1 hypothetical protein K254310026_24850 [Clostridium tetani]